MTVRTSILEQAVLTEIEASRKEHKENNYDIKCE